MSSRDLAGCSRSGFRWCQREHPLPGARTGFWVGSPTGSVSVADWMVVMASAQPPLVVKVRGDSMISVATAFGTLSAVFDERSSRVMRLAQSHHVNGLVVVERPVVQFVNRPLVTWIAVARGVRIGPFPSSNFGLR